MKTQYKIFISFIVIICACSTSVKSQSDDKYCNDSDGKKQYYIEFIQSRKTNALHIFSSTIKQARIFFHIVTDDDGGNPAATLKDVSRELDSMAHDYGPGNICFDSAGLNYVASTFINSNTVIDDTVAHTKRANDSLDKYYVPGCLNIFYVSKIGGENENSHSSGHGGYSFACPFPISMVAKNRLAKNTDSNEVMGHSSSHECGHLLGLMHTFDTSLYKKSEYIDSTDSYKRGDLMTDTPADPYAYNGNGKDCFAQNYARTLYTGSCTDLKGRKDFSPPYNNLMSYWKPSVRIFTSDQFYEVKYDLSTRRADVASADNNLTVQDTSYGLGYVYKSAINTLTTSGNVVFNGVVTAGLFGNAVVLKPGFHASPLFSSVLIKATACSTSGSNETAETSAPSAQKVLAAPGINKEINNNLVIYPNPSTSYFNIQYKQDKAFDAFVTVRNTNGIIVFSTARKNIISLQEKVNITGNVKGVYFVEVYINDKRLTAKVLMQ